jgi:hypothetical protein
MQCKDRKKKVLILSFRSSSIRLQPTLVSKHLPMKAGVTENLGSDETRNLGICAKSLRREEMRDESWPSRTSPKWKGSAFR